MTIHATLLENNNTKVRNPGLPICIQIHECTVEPVNVDTSSHSANPHTYSGAGSKVCPLVHTVS